MRYKLILLLFICAFQSFAQPVNDDCDGLIDLGVAPYCPDITISGNETEIYNNIDATPSVVGDDDPSCFNGGLVNRDVWFSFTTTDTILDYTITVMGVEDNNGTPAMLNPQVAIYRGSCEFGQLAELFCASANLGESMVELDAVGLTPGVTYYVRVEDYTGSGTPNSGAFKLCIDEIDPIHFIDEDGSSSCTGVLYDSGGPDGDYGNNEFNTFVICPDDPSSCITFGLTYYNIESLDGTITDQLLFYDGDEVNPNTQIADIGGVNIFDDEANDDGGGGGVCYEVHASSGCLTVLFVSDSQSTFEGFEGYWECSSQACPVIEPVTVDTNALNTQIVDVLSTPFTQVEITDIICDNAAYGTFTTGDNSDLGLSKGLILSTGEAVGAIGPNNTAGGLSPLEDRFQPGDADLDELSFLFGNGSLSQDACIVELDVFANTNEIAFEYVFGSEEYPEYINGDFNDIFAFLISGPGIIGIPEINNQLNIATLPDINNTFVQINSVNNLNNWEYYRNNTLGQSIQYDGLTSSYLGEKKSLTAHSSVIPCNTYHLKLAIADRGDGIFDSGVFVSEIKGGTPDVSVVFNSGIDYLLESCTDTPDEIIIIQENSQDSPLTVNVIITGTATQGEDYILELPDQLVFEPGTNEFSFPISVLSDLDDTEGIENIIITLTNDFGCGTVVLSTLEIELHDIFQVQINPNADTAFYCPNTSISLLAEGAAQYFWTPVNIFDNALSNNPTVTPTEDGWVYVEGTVGTNCIAHDSIYLLAIDPSINIAVDTLNICLGDSISILAENNVNEEYLSWTPTANTLNSDTPEITVFPTTNTIYTATIFINESCQLSDEVLVDVDFLNPPVLIQDTTICQHSGIILATLENPDTSSTNYSWTPDVDIEENNSPTPLAFPQTTTEFQLISTANNGACADTLSTIVTVLPADAAISPADTIYLCLGESVELSTITSTGSPDNLFWTPDDGSLSSTIGFNVTATPLVHTTYYTNFTIGECFVRDSVVVRVDSLPVDMQIMADPEKDPYCAGELVTLTSPIYEPAIYPEITHQWMAGLGFETPDTLYNMVITTVDTFTYNRITVNGGCMQEDTITLNVLTDEGISITPAESSICPGESVDLIATSPNGGTFSWTPTDGLSCTDCLETTATPNQTTTYGLEIEINDCSFNLSSTIIVGTTPVVNLIDDAEVCPGTSISLNSAPAEAGVTYVWTALNDPDFNSNESTINIAPTSTETYTLTVENACTDSPESYEVTITVPQPATIIGVGENQTICSGETFNLAAVLDPTPPNDDRLTWIYDGESEIGSDVSFTATSSGFAVFYYTQRVNSQDCETFKDSVFITVLESPIINLAPSQDFCLADAIDLQLNLASSEDDVTYTWTSPDDPNFSSSIANPTVSPTMNTTYELVATRGTCTVNGSVSISVIQPATLIAGEDQIITEDNTLINLDAELTGGGGSNEFFNWDINGTSVGETLNAIATVNLDDSLAIITYRYTCGELMDTILLRAVAVPNIFSPNGDLINAIFKPFYKGNFDLVELYIFNRWGQQVFESGDPSNPGWNGMLGDKPAPSDVYIYLIKVGKNGTVKEISGQVTLMR